IDGWYDSLGVNLGLVFLQPANDPFANQFSKSQYILGLLPITFTDATLPTYVSLDFGSPSFEFRATVTALGANGQVIGSANSGGHYLDENYNWVLSPYRPRSFASFHSEGGISRLVFETETHPSVQFKIDNLYFGNVPTVPEPATIALWAAGLGVIGAAMRRRHRA
ncbi:MAG TPA: PEP-CTERM sorting domain-containing protein, partial [Rhizobacter sp.]|nr:PEP-CTERM sorting domain-containing protein [Rhizobacter sp.]